MRSANVPARQQDKTNCAAGVQACAPTRTLKSSSRISVGVARLADSARFRPSSSASHVSCTFVCCSATVWKFGGS